MILSELIKDNIREEYNNFKSDMYASKSLEERKELDQFFTPPDITIKMIERFDCDDLTDKKILDPCCGSGNLLAACLIAGAAPDNIYGNEFDPVMVNLCKSRLTNLCKSLNLPNVPKHNIHEGDALRRDSLTQFNKAYEDTYKKDKEAKAKLDAMQKIDLW